MVTPQGTSLHVYTLRLSEGLASRLRIPTNMSHLQPENRIGSAGRFISPPQPAFLELRSPEGSRWGYWNV